MNDPASAPLIIVTLPGRDVSEVRRQAGEAARSGADAAEVRFDRWASSDPGAYSGLFPSPLPLVATLRSRAEGGTGPDSTRERRAWREVVQDLPFGWIDHELARDEVSSGPSSTPSRTILSRHLGPGEPLSTLTELLRHSAPPGGFLKVVAPATVSECLAVALPSWRARTTSGPAALMTTGPSGPLLRALAGRIGSAAVYCTLDSPTEGGTVEAAQIPVGRYHRWRSAPAGSPLFAVVGAPVQHSLSPVLHNLWMAESGRAGLYLALQISDGDELRDSLPTLSALGLRGLSVTHPLKDAAFSAATRRTPAADRVGCANTLTLDGAEVIADNTDLTAMERRLTELRSSYPGILRQVLVVGTGGAAMAALAACQNLDVRAEVLARNRGRAVDLARRFGAAIAGDPPAGCATLVVQATTVGRTSAPQFEVRLDPWVDMRTYLLDFVYAPDHPTVAELADLHGARYEDGRRLLAYAAAGSYAAWWGSPPDDSLVEQALREVL